MLHRRFISRLLNRPQLITPAAGAAVLAALMPGVRLDGWDGEAAQDSRDPREYQVAGRTAIIPIVGELVHRGGGMDALSGVTSYAALQDMVVDALGDPGVSGILLDIDSPGGEAGGNLDFAEWLSAQRGPKLIVASVNSMACSAAYAIASAADQILIGADAFAGSIGVVTYHTDISGALEKQGVVVTYTYAGQHKIDGNPTGPLTEQAQAELTGFVTTLYDRFCSVVAANRGLSIDAVRGTEAAIFQGQAAIDAGLADSIATQGEALMAMSTRTAPAGTRQSLQASTTLSSEGGDPATPAPADPAPATPQTPVPGEPGAPPADKDPAAPAPNPPASPVYMPADPVEVVNACSNAGYPELSAYLVNSKASMATVNAKLSAAKEIKSIAASVNLPGMAAPLIKAGMSIEDARATLFEAKAGKDAGIRTDTTPPPDRSNDKQPTINATAIYAGLNARPSSGRKAA